MSSLTIDEQLKQIAEELFGIARSFDCTIGLDIHKCKDGTFFGTFWKIGGRAVSFRFSEESTDFSGVAEDGRHLIAPEEDGRYPIITEEDEYCE